jgi:hypothetical protein
MSRKDYVAIAEAIREAKRETAETLGSSYVLRLAAEEIARALKRDNARFDRERFLTACGVEV